MMARQPQMLQMSADETGQMSSVETGQMSAVETRQMSAVVIETRQMSTIAYYCDRALPCLNTI